MFNPTIGLFHHQDTPCDQDVIITHLLERHVIENTFRNSGRCMHYDIATS